MEETQKQPRGFAAMSQERRREVARKAGQAAQRSGNGHRWTPQTSRLAGQAAQRTGKVHRWTQQEAQEASRRGVEVRQAHRLKRRQYTHEA